MCGGGMARKAGRMKRGDPRRRRKRQSAREREGELAAAEVRALIVARKRRNGRGAKERREAEA